MKRVFRAFKSDLPTLKCTPTEDEIDERTRSVLT